MLISLVGASLTRQSSPGQSRATKVGDFR